MLKAIAILFGIVLLAVGVLGFVPGAMQNGLLLGHFQVNSAHNLVHILTGVIALLAGFSGNASSRWFFRLFGIVYALIALHGFIYGDAPVLGIVDNNAADAWLHTGIAALSLFFGFGCCCSSSCKT